MARVTRTGPADGMSFAAPQPTVEREPTARSVGLDAGVVATVRRAASGVTVRYEVSDGTWPEAPAVGTGEVSTVVETA